jgi:hypothetical protein
MLPVAFSSFCCIVTRTHTCVHVQSHACYHRTHCS